MRSFSVLVAMGLGAIMTGTTVATTIAQPLSGFFLRSPRLTNAMTTFDQVHVWGAIYYFTIDLPSDIGQPLGLVTIRQREGFQSIDFHLDRTFAFIGTTDNQGAAIPVTTSWDDATQTISIVFDTPIPPGNSVTIGLRPTQNPDYSGIYLFGVTAYPSGEEMPGLYLGPGRLHFYQGGTSF